LAEVLAANNESAEALEYYQQAFETPLVKDPEWNLRLSLGLAGAALSQGKTDTALAVLLDAAQTLPQDYRIHQKLSETYQTAGLTKDAQDAAQQALELAPSDMENLLWFANQALELKIPQEASDALTRAAQFSSQNVTLLLQLGETQKRAGQAQAAKTSFQKVCVATQASLEELTRAAQNLLELDAVSESITCLERAQKQYPSAPTQALVRLYVSLVDAYLKSGNNKAALETVEKALEHYPADPDLLKTKASLYQETNRPLAALACLDQVFNVRPDDLEAHRQAMKILRANGNLQDALYHAEQMVRASSFALEPVQAIASRVQAAEFAQALLQPKLANLFLNDEALSDTSAYSDKNEWRDFQYLRAELELALEDGFSTTEDYEATLQIAPQHPRSLALQARTMARRGQEEPARQALQAALEALKAPQASLHDQRAVAEAALDLRAWDNALDLLQRVIQSAPPEPLPYLNLARALVLQAEYHKLCEALEAQRHAPGPKAISKEARQMFDFSIQNASQRALTPRSDLKNTSQAAKKSLSNSAEIQRWRVRGQTVFQSTAQANNGKIRADSNSAGTTSLSDQILLEMSKLPANPEDTAACIAALRQRGKSSQAIQMAKDYPYHPLVQGQLALAILEQQPEEALKAATTAVENLSVTNTCGIAPLFHVLLALCQQRLGELASAYQTFQTALADWDDESRWHSWAADVCLEQDDPAPAVRHMEKAIALEAGNPHYHLKLGKVYLRNGAANQAVQALEAASQLIPDQVEPWLALAETHLQLNNLTIAANYADQAIALQPGQIQPLLLRAEIALQVKEPQVAYKHILSALRIQNDHSRALHLLGKTLAALGRSREALQALEKAAQASSDPLPLLLERIRILRQFQGDEDALYELQTLASQTPDDVSILGLLAEILADMGQDEAAIQASQRALQNADGKLDNKQRADLHHLAGRLLSHSGHLDQAVHHLSESVQLNPTHLDSYMDLGQTYQERRQYNRALQVYQQAIRVAPQDPRPYHQASLALKETKDYAGAEKMIRHAAKLAPEDVRIQRLLSSLVAVNLVSSV
jgi:tetratricopeptide (TPR) repeat protein